MVNGSVCLVGDGGYSGTDCVRVEEVWFLLTECG